MSRFSHSALLHMLAVMTGNYANYLQQHATHVMPTTDAYGPANGAFGGSRFTRPTFYKSKARAKFKAQRLARRAQRKWA